MAVRQRKILSVNVNKKRPPDIQSGGHFVCVISSSFFSQFRRFTLWHFVNCSLRIGRTIYINLRYFRRACTALPLAAAGEDTQLLRRTSTATSLQRLLAAPTSARQPSTTQRSNLSLPAVIQSPAQHRIWD